MQTSNNTGTASLFFAQAFLHDGWRSNVRLTIENGRYAVIEADADPQPGDEKHGYALPGMPNLHSHAFQRAMAGLAERRGNSPDSFWTWRDVMYRFMEKMTPEDLNAIAAFAYAEMLESGFTRVGEFHYLHNDADGQPYANLSEMSHAIVAAANESGIGLTLLPVLYSYSGFGPVAPSEGQRRFILDMDSYSKLLEGAHSACQHLPDAVVGVAPHSLRAVSPDQLAALPQIAGGRPIHIHIAEQTKEVEDCLAWSGQRPVEWLLNHANVDAHWCLVHATHMTPEETTALALSGAVAGLCPITEANLGDGLFPADDYLVSGGSFGIGSDSNVLIDATEEMRLLEYGQRLVRRRRNILAWGSDRSTGTDIYQSALAGGARALGMGAGIALGNAADLVSLDPGHASLAMKSVDQLADSYIFAAGKSAIDCVWRYGRKEVIQGRHINRDALAARFAETLRHLIA